MAICYVFSSVSPYRYEHTQTLIKNYVPYIIFTC